MTTQILQPTPANIMRCAAKLKAGGLVAFPTETVYALGAVATDAAAVAKVFEVKGRPKDRPLIVAVSRKSEIQRVAKYIPDKAKLLIERFMPGALTLVLDKSDEIPDIVTAGSQSVAVRIPSDRTALRIIDFTGRPVVVPSANTSNKPSPTLAKHVIDDLSGRIDCIVDGGATDIGIESTIIDTRTDPPAVLRVGGVSVGDIESVIGPVQIKSDGGKSGSSYTPNAKVLFSAYYTGMADNLCRQYDRVLEKGMTAAIICLDGDAKSYGDRRVYLAGPDYKAYAHNLFALLRRADAERCDIVIASGVKPEGIGLPLINKLVKICGGAII